MKTSNRLIATTLTLAALAALAGLAGGCADSTRADDIRADLTPELETLYERQADMDNNGALTADENGRMFPEDLGRALYTNRPSRLTPEPVPRP